jgi:transcriptional regulator with XRE-family HTH domain
MQPAINGDRVDQLMRAMGLTLSELASRTHLTRQTVYNILRPGYQPFSKGLISIAEVLGVHPLDLLKNHPDASREIPALVSQAAKGKARAFELLPAALFAAFADGTPVPGGYSQVQYRLLAAAAETVKAISGDIAFEKLAKVFLPDRTGEAFFFGIGRMSPDRIVAMTPPPLKKHLVFGAFELGDFGRHFK